MTSVTSLHDNKELTNGAFATFMSHLIDYAGLFPPANLSLSDAIVKYKSHKESKESWMLGPFICSVSQFHELKKHLHLFSKSEPLQISALSGRYDKNTFEEEFENDMSEIQYLRKQYPETIVSHYELFLPNELISLSLLHTISEKTDASDLFTFCEVHVPLASENWEEKWTAALDLFAVHQQLNGQALGIKLRTGGVTADLFPTPEQLAFLLNACRDQNLPMKFTAGLHHPICFYSQDVKINMYGFFNVFIAGMLSHQLKLDKETVTQILCDKDASSFTFSEDKLSWQDLSVPSAEIAKLRKNNFLSFGSCSFDEPVDDLRSLRKETSL
jgi:hypothetical protein